MMYPGLWKLLYLTFDLCFVGGLLDGMALASWALLRFAEVSKSSVFGMDSKVTSPSTSSASVRNRESYMSAHVLLNLLNKLRNLFFATSLMN